MKLNIIASNMTELHTDDAVILFSYETPVAALRKSDHEYLRTDLFWSQTTSRHINKWGARDGKEIPQSRLDSLV